MLTVVSPVTMRKSMPMPIFHLSHRSCPKVNDEIKVIHMGTSWA